MLGAEKPAAARISSMVAVPVRNRNLTIRSERRLRELSAISGRFYTGDADLNANCAVNPVWRATRHLVLATLIDLATFDHSTFFDSRKWSFRTLTERDTESDGDVPRASPLIYHPGMTGVLTNFENEICDCSRPLPQRTAPSFGPHGFDNVPAHCISFQSVNSFPGHLRLPIPRSRLLIGVIMKRTLGT